MAWNPDQVPGASVDVLNAWSSAITYESFASSGWTQADDEEIQPIYEDFMRRTSEQLGAPTADHNAYLSRAQALMESFWDGRPDLAELRTRNTRRLENRAASQKEFLFEARQGLVDCAASAR